MKKAIVMIMILFYAVGCSTGNSDDQKEVNYVFSIDQQEIAVGDPATDFISALGEYNFQSSAPSCAFDGEDTVYDYPSYQITTYNNNGTEVLTGVYILDSSVATKENIKIGSTLDEVIEAYGEDYIEEYGVITYTQGKTELSFVIMSEKVTSISYIHVVE